MLTRIKVFLLSILPHHLLSRVMLKLTHARHLPFRLRIMHWFARKYEMNMEEAVKENVNDYPSVNALFTRALKPEARPIDHAQNNIVSPVDGAVSHAGRVKQGSIFQAKNHNYSLNALLGGPNYRIEPFVDGHFATLYLSPKDYHRIHMPCDGTLRKTIHIPGRLYSVARDYVENVPGLFAKNERLVCIFDTEHGQMAVILVGAIFVSSIETVWAGTIVPPRARRISVIDYSHGPQEIFLKKGEELGRFNMGSTVILLHSNQKLEWQGLTQDAPVTFGQAIAQINE